MPYKELNGKMPPQDLANFIRTSIGSPDFLRRGANYVADNNLFLFSNAMKEGWRADIGVAISPKTRGGWWFKTSLVTFMPKILMMAALYGLFGDWLKKRMEDISEYDLSNYFTIPIGFEEKNNKTIYLRIPQDETGRFIGGVFWKMMRIAADRKVEYKSLASLLEYGGGQLPSLSPTAELAFGTTQFLMGQNPYDFFRGQNVIPDQEFKAGIKYSWKPFVSWTWNQVGGGIFYRGYITEQTGETKSWGQQVVESPLISNIVGRWLKYSNTGQRERNREIVANVGSEEAAKRLDEKDMLNTAIKEYRTGNQNLTRRFEIERKLVKEVIGNPPYDKTEKTKKTNTIKKFRIGIIKGEADANINSVISATSNEQKIQLLQEIKQQMDNNEFTGLTNLLKKEKIISKDVLKELKKRK